MMKIRQNRMINMALCTLAALTLAGSLVSCKKVSVTAEDGTERKVSVRKLRNEDIDTAVEYITQAYAPYDDAVKQGFDIKKARRTMKWRYLEARFNHIFINRKEEHPIINGIDNSAMRYAVNRALMKSPVKDGHLAVYGETWGGDVFLSSAVFFSDVVLEKSGDSYLVITSGSDKVRAGMEYTGDETKLLKIFKDGKDMYTLGVISDRWLRKSAFTFDGKKIELPLEIGMKHYDRKSNSYGVKETSESAYISISDFNVAMDNNALHEEVQKNFDAFIEKIMEAVSSGNKQNIIVDLRGNGGGYFSYMTTFLGAVLYGDNEGKAKQFEAISNQFDYGVITLESPLTLKMEYEKAMSTDGFSSTYRRNIQEKYEYALKNQKRMWAGLEKPVINEIPQLHNSSLEGKIYILIDTSSASAAENCVALSYAEDKDKIVLVGMNTAGCIDFGNPYEYFLPNSKVMLYLCSSDKRRVPLFSQNPRWHGDTKGFYPDYWVTNEELIDTLVSLTGDVALRTALKGLEKGQLQ